MYFSNNQWFFNMMGRSSERNHPKKEYNVDISVNGKLDRAICFLYYSIENVNLRFVSKCKHANQSKNDLIKLVYKEPDETDTIKWKNTFKSEQIVLNTELAFKKVANFQKVSEYWNFAK